MDPQGVSGATGVVATGPGHLLVSRDEGGRARSLLADGPADDGGAVVLASRDAARQAGDGPEEASKSRVSP